MSFITKTFITVVEVVDAELEKSKPLLALYALVLKLKPRVFE